MFKPGTCNQCGLKPATISVWQPIPSGDSNFISGFAREHNLPVSGGFYRLGIYCGGENCNPKGSGLIRLGLDERPASTGIENKST